VARPTDNSHLCSCPFRHNPTLQHHRLSSVTITVTKPVFGQGVPNFSTAGCNDIDPYARHRLTPSRSDYAIIYGSNNVGQAITKLPYGGAERTAARCCTTLPELRCVRNKQEVYSRGYQSRGRHESTSQSQRSGS
jgi:hypothetical protein